MSTAREAEVGDILEDLVNQFSDPMAFFRELIQNSIDAGSLEVDIRIEYNEGESEEGSIIAHIDDFGEGMTREIIETKLTRLFSSTKDDDFTKIGRFGIGFVSVFAVEPDAVILDTARGGEAWRVIFHPDRTYDLIRLDVPVEGTQVKVIKTATREAYEEFKHRAVEVIQKWCKHAQVPIYFEGEDIRLPFDVESACKVTYEEEGTRIVAGYTTQPNAPYGFYNRGLTLKEGGSSAWHLMTFKIDSRYLEHTLTRDQVIEDRHYHKAAELLDHVAEELLPERLFELLEKAALESGERYDDLASLLYQFAMHFPAQVRRHSGRDIVRLKGREPIPLKGAFYAARDQRLYASRGADHLVEALSALDDQVRVIDMNHRTRFDELIDDFSSGRLQILEDVWEMPKPADGSVFRGSRPLVSELDSLLSAAFDVRLGSIRFGHFDYPGSLIMDELAWVTDAFEPRRVADGRPARLDELKNGGVIVFNLGDEALRDLLRVAESESEWAAYQLAKLLIVGDGLAVEDDDRLVRAALMRREARREKA